MGIWDIYAANAGDCWTHRNMLLVKHGETADHQLLAGQILSSLLAKR